LIGLEIVLIIEENGIPSVGFSDSSGGGKGETNVVIEWSQDVVFKIYGVRV
jgi:hypothetical protein